MDKEELKYRLLMIDAVKDDNEIAHQEEDRLFYDFVKSIIDEKYNSIEEIIEMAKDVYTVRDINFARWYA